MCFLKEHNLQNGYASFWHASCNTVLANENIKIRHIKKSGNKFKIYDWFNKNSWYEEYTNFVLIYNENGDRGQTDIFGVSENNIINYLGEPKESYDILDYIILVYDSDLSQLIMDAMADGVIKPSEMSMNEMVDFTDEGLCLGEWGMTYGPYEKISKGNYIVTYEGEGLRNAIFDIWSNTSNKDLQYFVVNQGDDQICISLKILRDVNDIEFRLRNTTDKQILLKDIFIKYSNHKP